MIFMITIWNFNVIKMLCIDGLLCLFLYLAVKLKVFQELEVCHNYNLTSNFNPLLLKFLRWINHRISLLDSSILLRFSFFFQYFSSNRGKI